ncbi:MAG: tetratricopeptide repeat protein [Deltaproteobacteria bacterium]|nr:tetratricopeptide repeat protein [Deltaproteobacteria bacterium]
MPRRTKVGLATVVAWAAASTLLAGCPSSDVHRARSLETAGKLEEAAALYLAAAKADPANLAAWDGAVETSCRKSTHVGACLNVLDLELNTIGTLERHQDALGEVLEARARARLEQGLVEAALDDLDRAEKAAPNRASVHVVRARAAMMRGDREGAIASITRARTLDPASEEANEVLKALPDE